MLKWYDGPKWKWLLWWKWFGYGHAWKGYLTNRGTFKGRFVATFDDVIASVMAKDVAEEIDKQILAGMSIAEDMEEDK